MRAVYLVQTVNPQTGAEQWVRVEAASREDAAQTVIALGEVVGEIRLAEVLAITPEPIAFQPAPGASPAPLPGACPVCQSVAWVGGRSFLIWLGVVLFFPLGLLFLLSPPRWRCRACGYAYTSHSLPPGLREETSFGYRVLKAGLILVVLIGVLILILAIVVREPHDPIEERRRATAPASTTP